ncbi:MAG: Fe-S cluster assembly protein SufD [Alphaproteobacteria bacterium]
MAATIRKPSRHIAFGYAAEAAAPLAAQPEWLARLRAEARALIAEGLPSPRVEEWKYTNLRPLAERRFAAVGETPPEAGRAALARAELGRSAHRLVFVNGRFDAALSEIGDLPPGVVIESLADALARDAGALEGAIGRSAAVRRHPLAAYNTAFFTDGALIRLADGVALDEPVHLVFVGAAGASPIAYHPRLAIQVGAGSRLSLIESHLGVAGAYWSNPVAEIEIGADALVRHRKLQDETHEADHLSLADVSVVRGGRYESVLLSLGAALARNEIVVRLEGEHAEARLDGGYLIDGKQHCDNTTRVEHLVPRGATREVYKGVLDGEARGAFQGTLIVHEGAVKTDAHQLSRTLMLSKGAEADAKPELEIYADDVKCSHGASAGALDPAQMFYLRSRGIGERAARAMLIEGFIAETIGAIEDEAVHGYFAARIARWLAAHAGDAP